MAPVISPQSICDFCGATPCVVTFDADPIVMAMFITPNDNEVHESVGGWMACEECAGFVLADQQQALLSHAITFIEAQNPLPDNLPESTKQAVRMAERHVISSTHQSFWKARRGITTTG